MKIFFLLVSLIFVNDTFSQWIISGNFNAGQINSILIDGKEIYAATSTQGVFRSDNNGISWIEVSSGLGNSLFVQTLTSKDNYMFAGTASGGVFYSANKGANWIQSNQGISQLNIKTMTADDERVYAGCIFAGIFSSTNYGLNWTRFGLGEGDLLQSISYNETTFFAGIEGVVYTSTNNGVNWALAINGLTNLHVRSIVQSPNKTYCGTFGGGVFVSENSGQLWVALNSGLSDLEILTLAPNVDNVFAGTSCSGIFYLNNASGEWSQANAGLSDTTVMSISLNDEYIFAGSNTGKVWRRPLKEIITGIKNNPYTVSEHFHLYQNFPNPFNPETKINYKLRITDYVSIRVYDALGKEITTLVNEKQNPGFHEVQFDGSNFSSGIYFYKIETQNFTSTKKMVLLK